MNKPDALLLAQLAQRAFDERFDSNSEADALLAARADDIPVAADALFEADDLDSVVRLVGSLAAFWQVHGLVDQGRELTRSVLDRAGDQSSAPEWGSVHLVAGLLAFRQGDQIEAEVASRLALAAAQAMGDRVLEAESETNLARVAFRDGDAGRIFLHANRVADLAGDDLRLRSRAVHMLGWAHHTDGNREAAMKRFEENAAIYASLDDSIGEAMEWANLGDLAAEAGDLSSARDYLSAAITIRSIDRNRYLAPSLVRSVGVLEGLTGNHQLALRLISASEGMYRRSGLEPDPGDTILSRVVEEAQAALGEAKVAAVSDRGSLLSNDEAMQLARQSLGA